ncbi:1,4-dihydroxy-2-naphthoate octaprenyltransferase [Postechiella marina]|uniref:1,4-dihydroxy-2-naphthoate octaprenyltransferase n=1 Tax=Postechiella marina TaxID=943941 RepID=A0ABP8C2R8_9FLAO
MIKKASLWISTMRLRTLPLSVSGIIVASCFAEYNGVFKWGIFALAMLTTLSLQILSNLANDYGDGVKGTDNKDRIGPERAIQSGKISPEKMFNAIKINVLICIVLAIMLIFVSFGVKHFLLTLLFFILGIASVVAAIRYTVGDKAYGYRALGDVFVFIFFGLVSVAGCYVLYAKTIDHVVFLPACVIGLLSAGVLNLNNMRDIKSDEKSNKITLAVKLGSKKIKRYHYFLVISALTLSLLFAILYYTSPYNFICFIAFVPILLHLIKVSKNTEPKDLNPELKKLALSTFLLAVLMGVGYII